MFTKLDRYILKQFLGTFFFTIGLIVCITLVFDLSEKIDNFIEHDLSLFTVVSEYYIFFIPYFANLFSPLFIFVAVILFTSRMPAALAPLLSMTILFGIPFDDSVLAKNLVAAGRFRRSDSMKSRVFPALSTAR